MKDAIKNILSYHFELDEGKEVYIVCDKEKYQLANEFLIELESRRHKTFVINIENYQENRDELISKILQKNDTGLILLTSNKMWGEYGFHRYFKIEDGRPSISCNCKPVFFDAVLPLHSFERIYSSNYDEDINYLNSLNSKLINNSKIRITSKSGTDISFISRDWQVDKYTEIHTSPVEHSINGKIVVNKSVFFSKVNEPIEIIISCGRIKSITCKNSADQMFNTYVNEMESKYNEDKSNWQMAEFGIGINSVAKISGIIMEDEAVRGTCHFCFGDNTRYGGSNKSEWHGGTVVLDNFRITRVD